MLIKERLYLTADRKKVVGEGDRKAAFLYAAPGDEIADEDAERFGIADGGLAKAAAKSPNKSKEPGDDKSKAAEGDKTNAGNGDDGEQAGGLKVTKDK